MNRIVGEGMQFTIIRDDKHIGHMSTIPHEIIHHEIGEALQIPQGQYMLQHTDGTNVELILVFNEDENLHDIFNQYTNFGKDSTGVLRFYDIANIAATIGWKMIVHDQTTGSISQEYLGITEDNILFVRDSVFYPKLLNKIQENGLKACFDGFLRRFGYIRMNQAMFYIAKAMFDKNHNVQIPTIDRIMKN